MKVKLIRATFAALFLATCGIAQGGNDSDRKGDVTDEKPKDVRYGRHSFADSTLSGGRAADLPGGVVVKTPSPCDFDPDRCSPPGSGSGGSGVTPPVQPPVASCKKQAASNLGGYGSAGANMVAWASVFNEPADATITEVRADIGGAWNPVSNYTVTWGGANWSFKSSRPFQGDTGGKPGPTLEYTTNKGC